MGNFITMETPQGWYVLPPSSWHVAALYGLLKKRTTAGGRPPGSPVLKLWGHWMIGTSGAI